MAITEDQVEAVVMMILKPFKDVPTLTPLERKYLLLGTRGINPAAIAKTHKASRQRGYIVADNALAKLTSFYGRSDLEFGDLPGFLFDRVIHELSLS